MASEAPQADSPFWWFWERGTSLHTHLYKLSTHPLMSRQDGENLVIVASKGGIDRNPAWYFNLKANPETTAWWHGRKRRVRARETEGAERERLWERMVEVWPDYEGYQRRTERRLPVIVLEPSTG